MTREQIEADIRALESVLSFITRQQNVEAVERSITRLRADLDAMPVGETRRVWIDVHVDPHNKEVASEYSALVWASEDAAKRSAMVGDTRAIVVADIPVRQVPVVNGKVSK